MSVHAPIHNRLESWGALETTLLWVNELVSTPEARAYPSYPSLGVYIKRGGVRFDIGGESSRYGEGAWVFPKEGAGCFRLEEGSEVLAIRFFVKWPNATPLFARGVNVVFRSEDAPKLVRTAKALKEFVFRNRMIELIQGVPRLSGTLEHYVLLQPLFHAWVGAYYTSFVSHGYEPSRFLPVSAKMRESLRYLRDRSLAKPFHERELAEYAGLSVSQLCKVFVQEIGMTPQSYWNERRLGAAKLDLGDRDKSIKEIAYSLGFSSQGHFSLWFRKQVGCTPRKFRTDETGRV